MFVLDMHPVKAIFCLCCFHRRKWQDGLCGQVMTPASPSLSERLVAIGGFGTTVTHTQFNLVADLLANGHSV